MAFGKPLLSSHVGYITIHEPESHIQFGHVSHFFRQCVDRSKFGTIVKLYNMTKSANNNIMTSLHLIRLMLEPG